MWINELCGFTENINKTPQTQQNFCIFYGIYCSQGMYNTLTPVAYFTNTYNAGCYDAINFLQNTHNDTT